jgi:hypothetical protein
MVTHDRELADAPRLEEDDDVCAAGEVDTRLTSRH